MGVAWLLGFGLLWLVNSGRLTMPDEAAFLAFTALLVLAGALTTWHLAVKGTGVRGASARQGAMYGWAWFLSFGVVFALGVALDRAGATGEVMNLAMTVASLLMVGALYMAGGAIWEERIQWVLGAWICVSTIAAALVGSPQMYLVMCIAGGGGMLVAAGVEAARRRRPRVL